MVMAQRHIERRLEETTILPAEGKKRAKAKKVKNEFVGQWACLNSGKPWRRLRIEKCWPCLADMRRF